MTQRSFPFASSKILTEDDYSKVMLWAAADGVCGSSTDTALKPTANGSSTITIPAGEAFVRGMKYVNDASATVTVSSSNATGSPRRDLVVLRNDPSADAITIAYKVGGTSLPSLTRSWSGVWEVPLAATTVANGTNIVQANAIVDSRWFTGWPVAPSLAAYRPPAYKDRLIVENGELLIGNGSAWAPYDPIGAAGSGQVALPVAWPTVWEAAGAVTAEKVAGGTVHVNLQLVRKGSTLLKSDADGSQLTTLPVGMRPLSYTYSSGVFTGGIAARVKVQTDGQVWVDHLAADVPAERVFRTSFTVLGRQ